MNKEGFTLIKNVPPGTCPKCAVKHEPELPHNQQSIFWNYWFYEQNGRWPTWKDAMEHCTEEVKARWTQALAENGIILDQEGKPVENTNNRR